MGVGSLSPVNMSTPRWKEYMIGVWIITDSDNWADSLVQLTFYEDGRNIDAAGMGDLHQ